VPVEQTPTPGGNPRSDPMPGYVVLAGIFAAALVVGNFAQVSEANAQAYGGYGMMGPGMMGPGNCRSAAA